MATLKTDGIDTFFPKKWFLFSYIFFPEIQFLKISKEAFLKYK